MSSGKPVGGGPSGGMTITKEEFNEVASASEEAALAGKPEDDLTARRGILALDMRLLERLLQLPSHYKIVAMHFNWDRQSLDLTVLSSELPVVDPGGYGTRLTLHMQLQDCGHTKLVAVMREGS